MSRPGPSLEEQPGAAEGRATDSVLPVRPPGSGRQERVHDLQRDNHMLTTSPSNIHEQLF